MRNLLSIILLFFAVTLHAQVVGIEVQRMVNDTIHAKAVVETLGGKLAEERFYRTLKSQENIPKQIFIDNGERPFYQLDSILFYSYAVDGSLKNIDTIYNSVSQYQYTQDDLSLKINSYFLEGRVHSKHTLEIGVHNGTPQDYTITFNCDEDPITYQKENTLLLNRATKYLPIEVTFVRGRNEYYVEVKNSNGYSKFISIETVGYDLLDDDFTPYPNKSRTKKMKLGKSPDLYLEVKGNYKLLTIVNKNGERKFPVSQLINPISKEYFTKGKNVLQLQNLSTGAIKVAAIKIRKL
jgi:hypothetical protein